MCNFTFDAVSDNNAAIFVLYYKKKWYTQTLLRKKVLKKPIGFGRADGHRERFSRNGQIFTVQSYEIFPDNQKK